jgi:hypothetical protein
MLLPVESKGFHLVQVFCIAEEDTEAGELKTDVKKFLYDLRMGAEVIVLSMKAWQAHQEDSEATGEKGRVDALEAFSKARKRITQREAAVAKSRKKVTSKQAEAESRTLDEQQVSLRPISIHKSIFFSFSNLSTVQGRAPQNKYFNAT